MNINYGSVMLLGIWEYNKYTRTYKLPFPNYYINTFANAHSFAVFLSPAELLLLLYVCVVCVCVHTAPARGHLGITAGESRTSESDRFRVHVDHNFCVHLNFLDHNMSTDTLGTHPMQFRMRDRAYVFTCNAASNDCICNEHSSAL